MKFIEITSNVLNFVFDKIIPVLFFVYGGYSFLYCIGIGDIIGVCGFGFSIVFMFLFMAYFSIVTKLNEIKKELINNKNKQ